MFRKVGFIYATGIGAFGFTNGVLGISEVIVFYKIYFNR
jgi:hypothetical protein